VTGAVRAGAVGACHIVRRDRYQAVILFGSGLVASEACLCRLTVSSVRPFGHNSSEDASTGRHLPPLHTSLDLGIYRARLIRRLIARMYFFR
jgi:hypothetical protein